MALGRILSRMTVVTADMDREVQVPGDVAVPHPRLVNREPFILFAIFSQLLNLSLTVPSMTGDIMAPSADGRLSVSKRLSNKIVRFLKDGLTLSELESVVAALNVCATKLWNGLLLFTPRNSTVSNFGSPSNVAFNTDQAVLTEHVIWRGPGWGSGLLEDCGHVGVGQAVESRAEQRIHDPLVREGVWNSSREDGARLAANVVARLLWKERQQKIEQKVSESAGVVGSSDMRVNPTIWRGSSGDL